MQYLKGIQDLVGFLVNDRVGLYLDVEVEGVSPEEIGWKEESDRIFFNFNLDQDDKQTEVFDPSNVPFEESMQLSGLHNTKNQSGWSYTTLLLCSIGVLVIASCFVKKSK